MTIDPRLLALTEPERSWAIERAAIYIYAAGMAPEAADRKALRGVYLARAAALVGPAVDDEEMADGGWTT